MTTSIWPLQLQQWLPGFMAAHPVLHTIAGDSSAFLHGSTTRGIDDEFSDLDIWLLVSPEQLDTLNQASDTRFFEFSLNNKPGHCNVHSWDEFTGRIHRCDMEIISELQSAAILQDPTGRGSSLLETARRPMPAAIRLAWFQYHYTEMRSEHRACDTPIERGDAVAVLQAMSQCIAHALRAALVLDRFPYPYVKWLHRAATETPTGQRITPIVAEIIDLLGQDALRLPGPEKQYPLSTKLREIRNALIAAAREQGINEPWLEYWYLHIDRTRQGIKDLAWPDAI